MFNCISLFPWGRWLQCQRKIRSIWKRSKEARCRGKDTDILVAPFAGMPLQTQNKEIRCGRWHHLWLESHISPSHYVTRQKQGVSCTEELMSGNRHLWISYVDAKGRPAGVNVGTRHCKCILENVTGTRIGRAPQVSIPRGMYLPFNRRTVLWQDTAASHHSRKGLHFQYTMWPKPP